MQNLLTKQEPEGAYNTDLHKLQKKKKHILYNKLNVCEDLEFIIQAFSSHQAIKSLYTIQIHVCF